MSRFLTLLCSAEARPLLPPLSTSRPFFAALSILDDLKRAPNPLHDLARDATRFLETQLNIARQIEASFGGIEADSRVRLRAQATKEELSWSEVEDLFTVPEGFIVEAPPVDEHTPVDEEGQPLPPPEPTANDIPKPLRSSLQCALHFQNPASRFPHAPLLLFNALDSLTPLPYTVNAEAPLAPLRQHNAPAPPPDYNALASGNALSFWIETFFPSILLDPIPTSQVVAAREWFKAQAQAKERGSTTSSSSERGGRGRGGGGRGGASGEQGSGRGQARGGGRGGRGRGGAGEGGRGRSDKTASTSATGKMLFVP